MVRHEVYLLILDMTGKVIDSSPTSLLVLIIPIAFLIVLLFKAWPVLLALLIFSISLKIWQQYQWKRWSSQVNPYFNQLIKDNQGCLTPLDLSMKANLSGGDARRYLDKKAEEFGAQRQVYEDKGTVYYFLTASALGSIFDESEPLLDLEGESQSNQPHRLIESLSQQSTPPQNQSDGDTGEAETKVDPDAAITASTTEIESVDDVDAMPHPQLDAIEEEDAAITASTTEIESVEAVPQPVLTDEQDEEDEDIWSGSSDREPNSPALIQAELAKRLDVHSSTVGKRKSDPDFSEWSQSRDPEGIAWEYSPQTKEFLPMEK
jgi:hypothetical protein